MFSKRPLRFDPAAGYITVAVGSGYVTQGNFKLSITNGASTLSVGDGKFGDAVPDVFLLPVPADQLEDWRLIILGSYAPAAGHAQIKVDYTFYQQGNKKDEEHVQAEGSYVFAEHHFTF